MTVWIRFTDNTKIRFGNVVKDKISVFDGDMFSNPRLTSELIPLDSVTINIPTLPTKMIGLWNNFHERAKKEGLNRPPHPLYFIKAPNCYCANRETIGRPINYSGQIVFEGELGVVIGKTCTCVTEAEADSYIFGYTCVNDLTARDILKSDPSFVQWTRAKSFNTFGAIGPTIVSGLDPSTLLVKTLVNGEQKQNYPVNDMFFSPQQIVSCLSQDMTLYPGDIIACGTSVGTGPLASGDNVQVVIDGIGILENIMQ